jgi:hypothetical protein
VPLRVTNCGELDALSWTLKVPVTFPFTVGAKLTNILQLLFGGTGAVQVFVCLKPALAEMPDTVREAVPVLVSVTVFDPLVEPTRSFPKLRLVGDTEPIATGVAVGVGVAVRVAVDVGVGVLVAVAVAVAVGVGVTVLVCVAVAVDVAVAVAVGVGIAVGVAVLVGVPVGVGVGEGAVPVPNAITLAE